MIPAGLSPGGHGVVAALLVEVVLMAVFLRIMGSTHPRAPDSAPSPSGSG
jgi:hypothetical protein